MYGLKAEHDVPAATKMGASFTHVVNIDSVWGGRLSKRFCNMFSESSTLSWA